MQESGSFFWVRYLDFGIRDMVYDCLPLGRAVNNPSVLFGPWQLPNPTHHLIRLITSKHTSIGRRGTA
jgi:hypothetical protein